jgi:protein-disulfide isomerase
MSARNNKTNKAAARERLRLEREAQAKKERTRRQLTVAGISVLTLAVAGGIGFGVMKMNEPSAWDEAKNAKNVTVPKNATGENGTTVVIGEPGAKKTLELYEDPRCPACAAFEQGAGETLAKDVADGKYKVKFVGATFIDGMASGEGSRNAMSALGAALDVSPEAFSAYKAALYSKEFHPTESKDDFAEDSYLLKVADSVPALKGNAQFAKNVKDGTFDAWAMKMSAEFDKSGVSGTPALKMDGKKVTVEGTENPPMSAAEYRTAVDKALAG